MPTISEYLAEAARVLQQQGIGDPRREAASLMMLALNRDKTFIIAHADYQLDQIQKKKFEDYLKRRAAREPYQYIAGQQEFFGLDFWVTPDVLIPRPETEIIVENAIRILKQDKETVFCEIGLGSGCISVSILHHRTRASAVGLDISDRALTMARRNAARHSVEKRLDVRKSDVFSALDNEKFELIVSNPPYIPASEIAFLQPEVRDYEPRTALTDEADGLGILEKIIHESPKYLTRQGILLLEMGFTQSRQIKRFFSEEIWQSVELLEDLQRIPRTVCATIK